MSIFGSIVDKIFHRGKAEAVAPGAAPSAPAPVAPVPASPPSQPAATPAAVPQQTAVDVGVVLETMADIKDDKGGNYRSSIVDLLKLLDLDSSLAARTQLAEELDVHAGAHGSAEQNIALHRAVMDKLAQNGGVVPDSLRQ